MAPPLAAVIAGVAAKMSVIIAAVDE